MHKLVMTIVMVMRKMQVRALARVPVRTTALIRTVMDIEVVLVWTTALLLLAFAATGTLGFCTPGEHVASPDTRCRRTSVCFGAK